MENIKKRLPHIGIILSKISSPKDLKNLSLKELETLCQEIRNFIIQNAAANGGHFGASLGTVEMTVALHYVFDTPNDQIVWDVGHQAYGHKLITGRLKNFHTNRKKGGISGFPKPSESEYDAFTSGHASISISAILGMATASKLKKDNKKHIAVIGDGALTGGESFEALNNAGVSDSDILVIVNDNQISIDKSVGALKNSMTKITKSAEINNLRWKIKNTFKKKGGILGRVLNTSITLLDQKFKNIFFPNHNLFEALNFQYIGPYDGHNLRTLIQKLEEIKNTPGPKILHLLTTKGKGFPEAEKNQISWHATEGFSLENCSKKKTIAENLPPKYQDVFGETIVELAQKNEKIIGITPAMPTGCSLNKMMDIFPERTFDVGICEPHAVTFSAGLATQGMIPFCNIYSSFSQRAIDQIIHDTAIEKISVIFCLDRSGLVGEDGETHQGAFDLAFLRSIPNIIIAAPRNEYELRHLMKTAEMYQKGPFFIRYPRGRGVNIDWKCKMKILEIGRGECLKEGEEIAVLSIGTIGNEAQKAIEGMGVAHYDMRFLKPLDEALLHEIFQKFQKIITIEDGVKKGGLGSAILEFMAENNYNAQVKILGIPDTFISHATQEEQKELCGIDVKGIRLSIEDIKRSSLNKL